MTEKPLVSVIINCYNSEKYLRETIDSLVAQTYTNWEAIFWDNCSTDKTAEIIASYGDSRFRYFLAEKNTPLGEARNLAMEKIQGVYFCFLDSDDLWTEDFLRIGVSSINSEKECVGFYCNYYNWYDGITKKENNNGWISGRHDLKYVLQFYGIAMSGAICVTAIAKKNNLLFSQHYQLVEDMDFFVRLLQYGYFCYDSRPLTYYRVYTDNTTHKMRNRWAVEYHDLYDRLYELLINTNDPKITKNDLNYIKIQEISCRAEDLITQNKRKELLQLLYNSRGIMPFRYIWSRIVFILTGKIGYNIINKVKESIR